MNGDDQGQHSPLGQMQVEYMHPLDVEGILEVTGLWVTSPVNGLFAHSLIMYLSFIYFWGEFT